MHQIDTLMAKIRKFTFNPFSENTFLLISDSRNAIVFDPGCYEKSEQEELSNYIEKENLKPVRLINTHCHIDHVLGNSFVKNKYGLKLECHQIEEQMLKAVESYSSNYGFSNYSPASVDAYIKEGDKIKLDEVELKVLFVPGHSPGHLVFYDADGGYCIGGDVLFQNSIGRTDLPGGDHDALLKNIREKMFTLPEDTIIYTGHGPETTIGAEKKHNPFF